MKAATVLLLLICCQARAGAFWRRVAEPENVTIQVQRVLPADVDAARREFGGGRHSDQHSAFTVLLRDRITGAWRCLVYLEADAPQRVLDHELKHCEGWAHE